MIFLVIFHKWKIERNILLIRLIMQINNEDEQNHYLLVCFRLVTPKYCENMFLIRVKSLKH